MGKSRILSQSKAVYVTKTGVLAGTHPTQSGVEANQLIRIDNFSYEVDIAGARQDIREFGQLARIGTLINSDLSPTFSMGYYLTDGQNEHMLGMEIKQSLTGAFVAGIQGISGFISEATDFKERNVFVVTVAEGEDAHSPASWVNRDRHDVVAFGNSFLTDYTVDLSVGEIPRADVSFEAANIVFYTGISSGLYNPSINPRNAVLADSGQIALPPSNTGISEVEVLRDRQIELDLQSSTELGIGGVSLAEIHPQSVSISVPLARESRTELGGDLPYTRPLTFPIDVTLSVNAIAGGQRAGDITALLTGCAGQEKRDITIKLYDPCDPTKLRLAYQLKNAVLDNQSPGQDLDGDETVDLTFSAQIGGANTNTEGFYLSGSYATALSSPLTPTYVSGLVG